MDATARDHPVVRVFFALVPPPALRETLGELARIVARRVHGRPVPADNIHLTLAFIGAWPVTRLGLLHTIGANLDGTAMAVTLDTLGGFRRAGVAWIGASGVPPEMTALATALGTALAAAGIAVDAHPMHPHLTLARKCRGPYPHDGVPPLRWEVDAISLMQSDTRAEGARYATLACWPLARVVGAPL